MSGQLIDAPGTGRVLCQDHRLPAPLRPGEVHLYVVPVAAMPGDEEVLAGMLDADELARAARFINPEHGRNFRRIRGLLRQLLGHYLSQPAEAIAFDYAEYGKPTVKAGGGLHFNLSHSKAMAAYAFSLGRELGVDIEYMREQKDLTGMLHHVASPQEQAQCLQLPNAQEQHQAFYRLWTRKESFIKAVGRGLGMGLRAIHIGVQETSGPLPVEYRDQAAAGWRIIDMPAPEGYGLAVCVQHRP